MIEIGIAGYKHFRVEPLVLHYKGTLACEGEPQRREAAFGRTTKG